MKPVKSILLGLGIFTLSVSLHAQSLSAAPDSIVQVTAEAQKLQQVSSGDLPPCGTFWLMNANGILSPSPIPMFDPDSPVYQISDDVYLVDVTGGLVAVDPELAGTMSASAARNATLAAQATI